QIAAADLHSPDFCPDGSGSRVDLHQNGQAVLSDGGLHRQLVDVRLEILFPLPSSSVQSLTEISLAVEQPHADNRNIKVGSDLDVIAREHSQSTRIDRERFVQAKLGGKVGYGTRSQDTRVPPAPGPFRLLILQQTTIGVVDTAMQNQFRSSRFQLSQREFC